MHTLDKRKGRNHKRHKRHKIYVPFALLVVSSFFMGCRSNTGPIDPEPGVSEKLATKRAQSIESLSYELSFTLPAAPSEPITGHEVIKFSTKDIAEPLVIDFGPGADHLNSISVAGRPSQYRLVKDHIIIP